MELERYLENGVQSPSFNSEEAEVGFVTCLRWCSFLGAQLVQEARCFGPRAWTAPRITVEIKDQSFTSISWSVLGRKISEKRAYNRCFRGYEEVYRWKGEKADERDLE